MWGGCYVGWMLCGVDAVGGGKGRMLWCSQIKINGSYASAHCIRPLRPPTAYAHCVRPLRPPIASAHCVRPPSIHLTCPPASTSHVRPTLWGVRGVSPLYARKFILVFIVRNEFNILPSLFGINAKAFIHKLI
jgi:hypothetical protein